MWFNAPSLLNGQELQKRRTRQVEIHWKMLCYCLSLKIRTVGHHPQYDLPIPDGAVQHWYVNLQSTKPEVYLTLNETAVLVQFYLEDYEELQRLRSTVRGEAEGSRGNASDSSQHRREWRAVHDEIAHPTRGEERYRKARAEIQREREEIRHKREVDWHRMNDPVKHLNDHAFKGGFSLSHATNSVPRTPAAMCRYLRERYGRETTFTCDR